MRTLIGPLFGDVLSNDYLIIAMANTLQSATALIQHPLVNGCGPSWASGWGQDRFGIFAEFSLPGEKDTWITQRMRWIPAGKFLMGSPQDESGHFDDELPQHDVALTHGFWMFDTPCTQALWHAVMESNSSRFIDPERPAEHVSWDDAQEFILNLNSAIEGLELQLPTEAMWEYACRASSSDATYAGPIKILGDNNAPASDAIAWYGGNSGVDYDLDESVDSTIWPQKQHNHSKAGTRKVKLKQPNRWGLYDMLGNVWEWCDDWYGSYPSEAQIDPTGPDSGHDRVLRGGSWGSGARHARAACRNFVVPGYRSGYIGFRCAQVQSRKWS